MKRARIAGALAREVATFFVINVGFWVLFVFLRETRIPVTAYDSPAAGCLQPSDSAFAAPTGVCAVKFLFLSELISDI